MKLPAILALLLIPVYWIALLAPAIGHYRDDAVYIVTAKSLAESGTYRIASLPDEPAQTKYPILLPALLAGVWKLAPDFPSNSIWLKTVPLLATALWLFFIFKLFLPSGKAEAAWIALIVASSPLTVFLATTVLADNLFACLVVAAIWLLDRRGRVLLAGLVAGAALLAKMTGAAIILAGLTILLLKRRFRDAAVFAIACAVLILPWLAWQQAQTPGVHAYDSWANYQGWNVLLNFDPADKLRVIVTNTAMITVNWSHLLGFRQHGFLGAVLSLLFTVSIGFGMWLQVRRGLSAAALFLLIYIGMLLLWAWPPVRFLGVALPFALYFSSRAIAHLWGCRGLRVACTAVLIALATSLTAQTQRTLDLQATALNTTAQYRWPHFLTTMDYIRRHTPGNAVLLGDPDPLFYLYTGRKAVRAPEANPIELFYRNGSSPLGDVENFARLIAGRGVTHIVLTPEACFSEWSALNRLVSEFKEAHPRAITGEVQPAPGYRVIEVDASHAIVGGQISSR